LLIFAATFVPKNIKIRSGVKAIASQRGTFFETRCILNFLWCSLISVQHYFSAVDNLFYARYTAVTSENPRCRVSCTLISLWLLHWFSGSNAAHKRALGYIRPSLSTPAFSLNP